jgi:hypothetical protein
MLDDVLGEAAMRAMDSRLIGERCPAPSLGLLLKRRVGGLLAEAGDLDRAGPLELA